MATSRPDVLPTYDYTQTERHTSPSTDEDRVFDPFEEEFPIRHINFKRRYKIVEPAGAASDSPVLRVCDEETEKEFAFKVLSKRQIMHRGWKTVEQANQEVRILRKLDHTFVVRFVSAWQTPTKLFIAMEYLPGGELYHLWKKLRVASDSLIRFFAAQVSVALDYLHSKYILYRDLKMENLMFDSGGYLKLIDFGASKDMSTCPFDRTWTICGTLAYCAPEMLNGEGYDSRVDWWALGIMCYALSCGAYPVAPGRDHREMRESINEHRYVAPVHASSSLEQMLLKLLRKDPRRRAYGTNMLRKMKFFAGLIDFEKIELRQYDPRAFYTNSDTSKLPESSLKRWITDYQRAYHKPAEFCIRRSGTEISIIRTPAAPTQSAMPPNDDEDHSEKQKINEWLLAQPDATGYSELPSFIQSGEIRGSTRSIATSRNSKHSFIQSGSVTRGATPFSSMRSNTRSDNESGSFKHCIWRRNKINSGVTTNENEFVLTSNSYRCETPAPSHKRSSMKSLWASFKERILRVTTRTNACRSKSLANQGRDRSKSKVKMERENDTGSVLMYVNVTRTPSHQQSIKSNPERRITKGNQDNGNSGQVERVIYIKPR